MSQVTEQSVRFQTALASIKLIQASAVLDLTEDDFDFLTSNKVWIATDRSRARRCVEACVYGTLDFVGYPRFPAPVEFRSEERRVGKECRSRWSTYHEKRDYGIVDNSSCSGSRLWGWIV